MRGNAWWCMVMHGDAWSCLIMHDHAWSCLIRTGSLQIPTYDKVWSECFFCWGEMGRVDGSGGKGDFGIYFYNLVHTDWTLQNGFVFFGWKQRTNLQNGFVVFWKMPIHRSQVGLVLQNGLVFFGWWHVHRWVYVLNNFTKWFCFFRKMKKHMTFLKEHY